MFSQWICEGKVVVFWVGAGEMVEVVLHVYDVTNCASDKTNNTIVKINKFLKDGIGLGGIFHCAVQVFLFPFFLFGNISTVNCFVFAVLF